MSNERQHERTRDCAEHHNCYNCVDVGSECENCFMQPLCYWQEWRTATITTAGARRKPASKGLDSNPSE